jgi:hypothetical protein
MDQRFDVSQLRIAKPCSAIWSEMSGDSQRRFCASCKKNVYNVAGMTQREVRDLIDHSEVLPCLRLSRRADGTVITRDCPVGVAKSYQRIALAVMGCLAFGFTIASAAIGREKKQWESETLADHLRTKPVVGPIVDKLCPQPSVVMGAMPTLPVPVPPTTPGPTVTVGKLAVPEESL